MSSLQMDRPNPKRHQPDTCRPLDERRDGPRRLCDDADDDESAINFGPCGAG